jgi:hypothetical protein
MQIDRFQLQASPRQDFYTLISHAGATQNGERHKLRAAISDRHEQSVSNMMTRRQSF